MAELNPPLGTTTPEIFMDNVKRADRLVNGPAETVNDRGGEPLDTWRQMMAKNDEVRQNIIPLDKQRKDLAEAQADIANIPPGSSTYVRSPDGSALAIEYMNVDGTLEPTGRKMPSQTVIDSLTDIVGEINSASASLKYITSVLKKYAGQGYQFLIPSVNGPSETLLAMTYDAAAQAVIIQITSGGGRFLKSRGNLTIQKGAAYLLAGRLSDLNQTDTLGITAGFNINNLGLAYLRTMVTSSLTEAWRYGTRDSAWPAGTGSAVAAAATTYSAYVPSAGLMDVTSGVVSGYAKGLLGNQTTATTRKLSDLTSNTAPLLIGGSQSATGVQPCYGAFKDFLCLHTASADDAVIASRLGM